METIAEKSQARRVAESFVEADVNPAECYVGAPPAPSTVYHSNYTVSYYADDSILICARGEAPVVLDSPRTYYRDTVEHAARCLGMFTQEQRAAMIAGNLNAADVVDGEIVREKAWIDGVCWNADGSLNTVG